VFEPPAWLASLMWAIRSETVNSPQSALTPGQAVVFYDSSRVLGGGWIETVGACKCRYSFGVEEDSFGVEEEVAEDVVGGLSDQQGQSCVYHLFGKIRPR
jgi:hypothetical protein